MSKNIREMMNDVIRASYHPEMQARAALRTLTDVMKGKIDNISPANPVIYAIENQAAMIAGFMESMKAETSRLLQVYAAEKEDLFPHMADEHFTGIYAIPASTTFTIVFEKKEITALMKPVPGTNYSKIILPRDTVFIVGDYVFGFHYPIDIIQFSHGGYSVRYDSSVKNKLHPIEKNMLEFRTIVKEGIEYFCIDIETQQFEVVSKTPVITKARSFSYTVKYTNEYYACRVYRKLGGKWVEIDTSYSADVYDTLKPTVLVKVKEDEIVLEVPYVYIHNESLIGELRIDVYSTHGPMELTFADYPIGSIGFRFRDLDKNADSTYSSGLNKLNTCLVLPGKAVTGGSHAVGFDELRNMVIKDSIGDRNLPITPAQIHGNISRLGYELMRNIDIVTDRVFLAVKDIPAPANGNLLSSANAFMDDFYTSINDLSGNGFVTDNGNSVTIKSNAVFKTVNGIIEIVNDRELSELKSIRKNLMADILNSGNYLYSPFHYVLRRNEFRSSVYAYYLDDPEVVYQTFIQENESTGYSVFCDRKAIRKTDDGYKFVVVTKSNDAFKELEDNRVFAFLGFRGNNTTRYCWMAGNIVRKDPESKERVFEFDLTSSFNLDESGRIDFGSFKYSDNTVTSVYCDLNQDFILLFGTDAQMSHAWSPIKTDGIAPKYLSNKDTVVINEEMFGLRFGIQLKNLWIQNRVVTGGTEYETYESDVIYTYEENVYRKDPDTGNEIFMINGKPTRELLHAAGDPVLDSSNQPQIRYRKGDVKKDSDGNPIIKHHRYLKNRFKLFLVEGIYLFSDDPIVAEYRNRISKLVSEWIYKDITNIQKTTMDKTKVYFSPKISYGTVEVKTTDGHIRQLSADQSFRISITLGRTGITDMDTKRDIKRKCVELIGKYLNNKRLSNSELVGILKNEFGMIVVDIQMELFGQNKNMAVIDILDENKKVGIRKKLYLRDDDVLSIEEDVEVEFKTI